MKILKYFIAIIVILNFPINSFYSADNGASLFQIHCSACHLPDRELVGPALLNAEKNWDDKETLFRFIRNSQEVISEGYTRAVDIFEAYNRMIMPAVNLTDNEIKSILAYIDKPANEKTINQEEIKANEEITVNILNDSLNLSTFEWIFAVSFLILLFAIFYVILQIFSLIKKYKNSFNKTKPKAEEYTRLIHLFKKPEESVKGILLDNHEYDEIKEYDHNPPAWFNWLFSITVIWGILYFMYYHVFQIGPDQYKRYETEMTLAEAALAERTADINFKELVPFMSSEAIISGKQIFIANCAVCHGSDAKGGIGPDLTDKVWIHGSSFSDIYKIIFNGVPEKGMIPWKGRLNHHQLLEVSSYIYSL